MNLGKENILNDSEAVSSAFQRQNKPLYFALEKSSPHRALWTCGWAAFWAVSYFESLHYTAHYYTDKTKHLALFKLLSNKQKSWWPTKSQWLLKQNWRLCSFFHYLPFLVLSIKLHRKHTMFPKPVHCMLFHLIKSVSCGSVSSLYTLDQHYCAGMLLP